MYLSRLFSTCLHLALGQVCIGEVKLAAGDAVTAEGPLRLEFESIERSQALLFDLA